jgi:methionyl-tRNA formyltransferase
LRRAIPIGAEETAGELHDRLSTLGAQAITEALARLDDLEAQPQPDRGVTYAQKIDKAEARLDWTQDAPHIDRQIRGLSPFPGAWTMIGGKRVKILRSRLAKGTGAPGTVLSGLSVACGSGAVDLTEVQPEGKPRMTAEAFLRGARIAPGAVIGGEP